LGKELHLGVRKCDGVECLGGSTLWRDAGEEGGLRNGNHGGEVFLEKGEANELKGKPHRLLKGIEV